MPLLKRRIYAFVIDLYAIFFLVKASLFVFSNFIQQIFPNCPENLTKQLQADNPATLTFTLNLLFFSYFFFCYYLTNGLSLGKLIMKIRIYSQSTQQISMTQAFLRAFSQGLYYLAIFLPFSVHLVKPHFRSLGDRLADTFVDLDHGPRLVMHQSTCLGLPLLDVYPEAIPLPYTTQPPHPNDIILKISA